ncbi:Eco57I restriction-modification methylase domain-containing protein [Streptosporangium sp. NBC_01469]|uniref:Eco57I restriction-modification methylase domain-containing protein n=1 Tax=Streptosporangium sp. NBC_01469 TaxID=2903898 RepID=UPI002E296C43|nr:type IIL restriction-modification enzyme MmeI [Streptosporangium sp. NBC_01469]
MLGLTGPLVAEGAGLPEEVRGYGPADTRVRPDGVAFGPDGAGGRAERLHIYRRGWAESLTKATRDRRSAVEEAADLCRRRGVPLALLTNGQLWVLVHARVQEPSTVATFDADLWLEERDLLRAFTTLLGATRVLKPATGAAGDPTDSLAALFSRSADAQAEVTNTLGRQVLRAVELLVGELARLDRESGGELLAAVPERRVYRGTLSVMMRLVFLLYAEDQRLLPVDSELYAHSYSVGGLFDELEEARSRNGEAVGDRRRSAWPRLLALFGAVHGGCEHDDLRIPPYGGALFDPERFAWLADMKVTDRVVHEILRALLILVGDSGAPERLSYKGLNVEQIGHVYEGLLEFSCVRVTEPYAGLFGKTEPELPLAELERARREEADLAAWVVRACDTTANRAAKALAAEAKPVDLERLRAACDNDDALSDRATPFLGLLRRDLRDRPTIFPEGSLIITQVGDRRSTGTHYTPRPLAEEVVEHTLAPLCFSPGPAEGAEPHMWRAKRWDELLALKVLDPAMGSGAFLVSACRYIADRIVDDWERNGVPGEILDAVGPDYDRDGLLLEARRRVTASCIYGVDRDDQAVELAKLSLWLVTLAKDRPFSFLDHALRCGDSLIGVVDDRQLVAFDLDPEAGNFRNTRLTNTLGETVGTILDEAERLRVEIESEPVRDTAHGRELEAKLATAEALTGRLRFAADAVVAAALAAADEKKQNRRPHWEEQEDEDEYGRRLAELAEDVEDVLAPLALAIKLAGDPGEEGYGSRLAALVEHLDAVEDGELYRAVATAVDAEDRVRELITPMLTGDGRRPEPIRPFHWPLEFPEVMRHGGFAAVVGNPPFIGGQFISGIAGDDYREYLVEWIAKGKRGSADLCSYFLLRNLALASAGRVGIIASKAVATVKTRAVGLDQAVEWGWNLYRGTSPKIWPGTASVFYVRIWLGKTSTDEKCWINDEQVLQVATSLGAEEIRIEGEPIPLIGNLEQSFQGVNVLGLGFTLSPENAQSLIDEDPRNNDVIFPYVDGKELNSRWDSTHSKRWIINFRGWTLEEAQRYPGPFAIVEREVKPFRATNKRQARRERWWQYAERAPGLVDAIVDLNDVVAIARVSSTAMATLAPARQVLNEKVIVFTTDDRRLLALLASQIHIAWAWKHSGSLKGDLQYTPTRCFETFPQPTLVERMRLAGQELDVIRRRVMTDRREGLTKIYNRVDDDSQNDDHIRRLRAIHVEIDEAVRESYALDEEREPAIREFEMRMASAQLPSWREIDLSYGFHLTRQGIKFTISPEAQADVLDKLLVLNHYRHRQELEQGIRKSKKARATRRANPVSPIMDRTGSLDPVAEGIDSSFEDGLFPPDGALF